MFIKKLGIKNFRNYSDVEIEYGDKVIALVTCSYETNNSRYVLYGKLGKQIINESQRDLVNVEQGRSLN